MKTEEKDLLLKDLCARLPYGVKVQVCNATEYTPILKGILGDDLFLQFDYITKPIKNGDSTYNLIEDNIKPYLRPMSSMTEEEQEEFVKFHCVNICPMIFTDMLTLGNESKMFDWLNEHHFDYRGLISMGLALEAPEGMYKNKEK